MDLHAKIKTLPETPGVYLYKDAEGKVLYVGKAKNLRARLRTYFLEASRADIKTGSLMREAADVDTIVVDNEREALALENNLIKRYKPRFNILLRDDKTYPYIKLTAERYPRVYVTRRVKKDGAQYYGPYFPANLAHRTADLIHRVFRVPSCHVDLERTHPRPCLQYYIHRCLGPCVRGLTTEDGYAEAARHTRLFLEGRGAELARELRQRMERSAAREEYEAAAKYRDLLSTVEQLQEKQRMAAAEGDDTDVIGFHTEDGRVAVNIFHLRGGRILDRRELFWESLPDQDPGETFSPERFLSALVKQLYIGQRYVPRTILLPADFDDREAVQELLTTERRSLPGSSRAAKVELVVPQRGEKRSLIDLAGQNAKQSYDQRFRVMKPALTRIQEALQEALGLPAPPKRIEAFDMSHIQGSETVASLVVWMNGRMNKSDYRKFRIQEARPGDDLAAIGEVVRRRYGRVQAEKRPMPDLILIDGGAGQLHAAAVALEKLGIINQPLVSIAKREEVIHIHGQEGEPLVLERHSPVLHLVQMIRDESHRFAVAFHRKRREIRDRESELLAVPGIGKATAQRLVRHFGSVKAVRDADAGALAAVVNKKQAQAIREHFQS
jgi:excinuclease ABC subunit C